MSVALYVECERDQDVSDQGTDYANDGRPASRNVAGRWLARGGGRGRRVSHGVRCILRYKHCRSLMLDEDEDGKNTGETNTAAYDLVVNMGAPF